MITKLLDHGYVEYVEHWGSDEQIIEAARMSTNKGFQGWGPKHAGSCMHWDDQSAGICDCKPEAGDEKLLTFLWLHKHQTPFEMAGLTIEVMAPMFVFREWHRHRTQSYNEMSARYTPLPDVNYIPRLDRVMISNTANKQANAISQAEQLTSKNAVEWLGELNHLYNEIEKIYQKSLKAGIPKELARIVLPVGRYSRMRASANLRNWLGFLTLRQEANAQWEIRQYANVINTILTQVFPRTMAIFNSERT